MNPLAKIIFLIMILIIYLAPLFIIVAMSITASPYKSQMVLIDSLIRFLGSSEQEELFVTIILPLLSGISAGAIVSRFLSFANAAIILIFIMSLIADYYLIIHVENEDISELLRQRELPVEGFLAYLRDIKASIVMSLTILLGISAGRNVENQND